MLPLRDSSVDVIVSDLPFGQRCLSTHRLSLLVPLMMYECARVLREGSGRMVLLCGVYSGIVDSLMELNKASKEQQEQHQDEEERKKEDHHDVFQTPFDSVFPVNIGGLSAWIIIVRRGYGKVIAPKDAKKRTRQLFTMRERQHKHEQSALNKERLKKKK
eukprot:15091327-Ditylum_brightwellii.AAC.1